MSNIVIPTQDHQTKAFQQPSQKKDELKNHPNVVLPTQDHQLKLFEQKQEGNQGGGANVSNVVIPDQEQLKAFETENTKLSKKQASDEADISHTQFTTSVYNLLTSSGNSIFSKYTRQFDDLVKKLDSDKAQLIIFSPTDVAIESLSQKPWEFPKEVTTSNDDKDQVSNLNIRNFLESHIVDSSTDFKKVASGKGVDLKTVNGNKLQLVNADDGFKVLVGAKEVANVVDTQVVGNGALLTIDGPLQWPSK